MNTERIRELSEQAAKYAIEFATQDQELYIPKLMEKFAALVAAEEREACAKVCEEYETDNDITATLLNIIADAIRARGNE